MGLIHNNALIGLYLKKQNKTLFREPPNIYFPSGNITNISGTRKTCFIEYSRFPEIPRIAQNVENLRGERFLHFHLQRIDWEG